ncbi:adenosylcobinamide-GDP ribazoletransferase [Acidianus ambivalens]|uniref:Adenosylcobinamide-GDP ribazoletransferase n=1 Tax=Acidianus ambivalens TaxID=2283 RepID=A0A650CRX9_ACIAM|nr:adenosylcobinamide-GDP ribazoletransferase [Acidianus ambivalens]MQL55058.1 adenosylcobinamide-GDP ribazoletransferase [Acidianus ambivalens]QGR20614.1 adenosylcobinamide-GDP ribazoletransferase [Acidianus ambivalens]
MKALKGVLSQLSFFTIIPSVSASLEEIAEYSFISPIFIGVITGVIDFVSYFSLFHILGYSSRFVIIIIVEVIRGFNHLDGLLDLGDAIMIKGDYERKLKALKDVAVGSGGIGLAIVYFSLFLISLCGFPYPSIDAFLILISAEVLSRDLGILILSILEPMESSYLGKLFHDKLKDKWVIIIAEGIPFLFFYPFSVIIFFTLFLIFYEMGKKVLRGSSGDLTGAIITISFPLFLIAERLFSFLIF